MAAVVFVSVTNHAAARWRERVTGPVSGSAVAEVVAAVKAATPVGKGDILPFGRVAGRRYFRHAEMPEVYFVCEPSGLDGVRVMTVVVPERLVRPPDAPVESPPADFVLAPEPLCYPSANRSIRERADWAREQLITAQEMVSRCKATGGKRPPYRAWVARQMDLQGYMRRLKGLRRTAEGV